MVRVAVVSKGLADDITIQYVAGVNSCWCSFHVVMAVNFCHEYLGTKALCSQVVTESHEVNNLISNNTLAKNRGFLADSFVRPPVDIILQFPCPIKICCVTINGRVGSQQSTGCEVFVQSEESSE